MGFTAVHGTPIGTGGTAHGIGIGPIAMAGVATGAIAGMVLITTMDVILDG